MRTGRSLGSISTGELVEKPVRGRTETLLVLLSVVASQQNSSEGECATIRKKQAQLQLYERRFEYSTYGPRPMFAVFLRVSGGCWRVGSCLLDLILERNSVLLANPLAFSHGPL